MLSFRGKKTLDGSFQMDGGSPLTSRQTANTPIMNAVLLGCVPLSFACDNAVERCSGRVGSSSIFLQVSILLAFVVLIMIEPVDSLTLSDRPNLKKHILKAE